jgi:hypothetical protein
MSRHFESISRLLETSTRIAPRAGEKPNTVEYEAEDDVVILSGIEIVGRGTGVLRRPVRRATGSFAESPNLGLSGGQLHSTANTSTQVSTQLFEDHDQTDLLVPSNTQTSDDEVNVKVS